MRTVLKSGIVAILIATLFASVVWAAASYPAAIKVFTNKNTGDIIQAGDVNQGYDEITAVETGLLNGFAHAIKPSITGAQDLGTTLLQWRDLYISGSVRTNLPITGPRPWIDITAAPYNADPTGVTASTAAFTSVIAAAPVGSVILIPNGSYLMNNFIEVNKSGLTFVFMSGATLVAPASPWTLLNRSGQNFPPMVWIHGATDVNVICLGGQCVLNASAVSGSAGFSGIIVGSNTQRIYISGMRARGFPLWPFWIEAGSIGTETATDPTPQYVTLRDNVAETSGSLSGLDGGGFKIDGNAGNSTNSQDIVCDNCRVLSTNFFAFDIVRVTRLVVDKPRIVTAATTTVNQPLIFVEAFPWSDVTISSPQIKDTTGATSRGIGIQAFQTGNNLAIKDPNISAGIGILVIQGGTAQGKGVTITGGQTIATNGHGMQIGPSSGQGTGNVQDVVVSGVTAGGTTGNFGVALFNNNTGSILQRVVVSGVNGLLGAGGTVGQVGLTPTNSNNIQILGSSTGPYQLDTGTLTTALSAAVIQGIWNNAGVAFPGVLLVNMTSTASATQSLLADLQLAGVSQWNVTKGGNTTQTGPLYFATDNAVDIGQAVGFSRPRNIFAGSTVNISGASISGAHLAVTAGTASNVPAVFRGATAQTADLFQVQNSTPTNVFRVDPSGVIQVGTIVFANLSTPGNGSIVYCSDCTVANPCAGSGPGALAKRIQGAWVCN